MILFFAQLAILKCKNLRREGGRKVTKICRTHFNFI